MIQLGEAEMKTPARLFASAGVLINLLKL